MQEAYNPFADPTADQIPERASYVNSPNASNFNPFQNGGTTNREQPAVLAPTLPPPLSHEVESAKQNFVQNQEKLNRAADNIEKSQPDVQSRTVAQVGSSVNNFPPLPSCCPVRPCFYQDIGLEIPAPYRSIVLAHFFYWITYVLVLLLNVVASLVFLAAAANKLQGMAIVGFSVVFLVVCVPGSYTCWFRPIYKAFRSDSSMNFFWYFFVFFVQIIKLVLISIGIYYYSVGWLSAIDALTKGWTKIGILLVVVASLFDVLAVVGIVLEIRVNRLYRSSGASFNQAKQEFNHNVVTNQYVQQTASSAGSAAARGAVDQTFTSSRY